MRMVGDVHLVDMPKPRPNGPPIDIRACVVANRTRVVAAKPQLVDTLTSLTSEHVFALSTDGATRFNGAHIENTAPSRSLNSLPTIDVVVFRHSRRRRPFLHLHQLLDVGHGSVRRGRRRRRGPRPPQPARTPHAGPHARPSLQIVCGLYPHAMVHGLTLGEAANMGCAEGWIEVPVSSGCLES